MTYWFNRNLDQVYNLLVMCGSLNIGYHPPPYGFIRPTGFQLDSVPNTNVCNDIFSEPQN
jgi:hypothetical protein